MKISISYFQTIRNFKPNQIPISTSSKWPFWVYSKTGVKVGEYFVDKNNIVNGIIEEDICFPGYIYETLTEKCSSECSHSMQKTKCQFMDAYKRYLDTLDFSHIISEFKRVSEDVRKITHYEGEPEIVLMVYEHPRIPCAERPVIRSWFEEHGMNLPEWKSDFGEEIF